VNYTH